MNIDSLREYCLGKPHVTEALPFGPDVLVFKVAGKMFLLIPLDTPNLQFNAKCDPERCIELREKYPCIKPGYHMDKSKWNTVLVDYSLPANMILGLIDHSYEQVVLGLPKKTRKQLFTDDTFTT
ncbi:MAG: MmcQ/YjbR family DNA-binding protein [Bacteroidota bacterium]|jgi:predicted DNA-binding protein (MmcQ/YjbR family)